MLDVDEVQRGGEPLVLALKQRLDADRSRGQVVLTGSSNFLAVRSLRESLAGRVAVLPVLPLAQAELLGTFAGFHDALRAGPAAIRALVGTTSWPRPHPAVADYTSGTLSERGVG